MRIHVTGNAGAGKTTLAHRIGAELGLPVHSLDAIVWQPGWKKTPADERRALEEALVDPPRWVIDGVSARVREASDVVIFLDVPRTVCAVRALRRSLRSRGRTRPGLPPGCPEWRIVPRLLELIWRFPSRAGQAIRDEAADSPHRYRVVTYPAAGVSAITE